MLSLFEETKKDKKERKNKYIKDTSGLPELQCPEVGSLLHNRDIDMLKHYFNNKSLSKKFLELSDDSCKQVFKNYCKKNNLKVNWDFLKRGLKDVNSIVFSLKQKYNRPRPKELLKLEDPEYENIIDVDSPSFPSGHTTTAFFIASVLSDVYPEEKSNFKTLAELIGQSRIENCVHYPSDVIHGQLLGELLSSMYLSELENKKFDISKFKIKRKDEKEMSSLLRNFAFQKYSDYSNPIRELAYDMTEFIVNSCKFEQINIDEKKCYNDVFNFMSGYPIKNISNKNIRNHIKLITCCNKLNDTDSLVNLINLHKEFDKDCLEKGKPGVLRSYEHQSIYGNSFSKPKDIIDHMKMIKYSRNPFIKHILYEWVHPFCDGNGRTGRIILLKDTGYDFDAVNNFCGKNYLKYIQGFVDKYKNIENVLNV
jgi:hypothetical protein